MSDAWFYLPTIPHEGERIMLDDRESRHASGARRLREGQKITVFDGRGCAAGAVICRAAGKSIEIELGASHIEPPLIPAIHLAAVLPKGDRQSVMLNMATQLGIASFTPIESERAVVRPGGGFAGRAARIVLEACKQSRNAHLPVIEAPVTCSDLIEAHRGRMPMMLAHPGGRPIGAVAREVAEADDVLILIGPEGGFSAAEVDQAREAGVTIVDLGRTILRTETAAVAFVTMVRMANVS